MSWAPQLTLHVEACWLRPNGITDQTKIAARITFELNPEGTRAGEPTLLELTAHPQGVAFAESAIAAIKRCSPYTFLPAEEYKGGWDKIEITFSGDPATASKLKSGTKIDAGAIKALLKQK
jgi:hypothetical protein